MRIAGRINLMLLVAVIAVVLAGVFILAGRSTPSDTANQFMVALANHQVDDLMKVTFIRKGDEAKMRQEYEFATKEAGPYYSFAWRIKDEKEASDNTASVQLSVLRNIIRVGPYEENFAIPLTRVDGKWLVDVTGINSAMYPGLPR